LKTGSATKAKMDRWLPWITRFCPRTNGSGPRLSCLEVSNVEPESSVPCIQSWPKKQI